jgi:signal transduction histidine kinase
MTAPHGDALPLRKRKILFCLLVAACLGTPGAMAAAGASTAWLLAALLGSAVLLALAGVFLLYGPAPAQRPDAAFISFAGHELRTPLAAISGIAEILDGMPANLDAKQRLLVKTLRSSASALNDIVNDLGTFSKLEEGSLKLQEAEFRLDALVGEVAAQLAPQAAARGILFTFSAGPAGSGTVMGDYARLRLILSNLLNHVLQSTAKGDVSATAKLDGDVLTVEVRSATAGIDPRRHDIDFGAAESGQARRSYNSSLGLLVALRLVRLMKGGIAAGNAGDGSVISLTLPLRMAKAAEIPAALRQAL